MSSAITTNPTHPNPNPPKSFTQKPIFIVICVVIVLAIMGILYFIYTQSDKKNELDTKDTKSSIKDTKDTKDTKDIKLNIKLATNDSEINNLINKINTSL